jgi:hypothetical protein
MGTVHGMYRDETIIQASKLESVGVLFAPTGILRVTDPCYQRGTWCCGQIEVEPGTHWNVFASRYNDPMGWGNRVASLLIVRSDREVARHPWFVALPQECDFEVGVDSGQAGFFDDGSYPHGETGEYADLDTFYGKACAATHEELPPVKVKDEAYSKLLGRDFFRIEQRSRMSAGMVGDTGAVAASGYGDGSYTCYVWRDSTGRIWAAEIVFIGDYEEEEA